MKGMCPLAGTGTEARFLCTEQLLSSFLLLFVFIFKEDFIVLSERKYINTNISISSHVVWLNEDWIYLTKLVGGTLFFFVVEVQLIWHNVLVSDVQQVVQLFIYIIYIMLIYALFQTIFHYRLQDIEFSSCAIQYILVVYLFYRITARQCPY